MHTVQHITRNEFNHTFRCTCGEVGDVNGYRTRAMAEDAADKHLDLVARVTANVRGRTQSLESYYQHCRGMADNPNVARADRDRWEVLATETGHRLGIGLAPEKQEELFTL